MGGVSGEWGVASGAAILAAGGQGTSEPSIRHSPFAPNP